MDDNNIDGVYTRAYDQAYFLGYNGEYGRKAGIAGGVHAVAVWARKEALEEAAKYIEERSALDMYTPRETAIVLRYLAKEDN